MPVAEKQVSSMMKEPLYNAATQTLTIRFKSGGAVHEYAGFSQEDYDALISAPSWGKHFITKIRPRYEGQKTRVDSPEQKPS